MLDSRANTRPTPRAPLALALVLTLAAPCAGAALPAPAETAVAAPQAAAGADADALYREGQRILDRRGPRDFARAIALFEQASAADPRDARPWASMAVAHVLERAYFEKPAAESWRRARDAADHAVELGPRLADAHAAQGLVALNASWDFARAERAYRRALQLDPAHVRAMQWLAELMVLSGRYGEALPLIREAEGREPDSPLLLGIEGYVLASAGRLAEAEAVLRRAVAQDPAFSWIHEELARVAELRGDVRGAMDARREEMQRRGVARLELDRLDAAMALHGLRGFYLWRADWAVQKPGFETVAPELAAETLAALGRHAEAREILRGSAHDSGESLLHMLVRSPAFRHEPYRVLAREFGLTALVIPVTPAARSEP